MNPSTRTCAFISMFFVFTIILSAAASSISVVSDFLQNDTMILQEGESRLYGIRLQNGKDFSEFFEVTYDKKYASIIDHKEIYEVLPKSSYSIKFNISADSIPEDETVAISYTVHQLSGSGEGVPLLLKINKNFKVKVEKNNEEIQPNSHIIAALAIIVLSVAYWTYSKRKKHKSKPKRKEFL